MLAEIHDGGTTVTAIIHKESDEIPSRKGVQQGDTMSHKLYSANLEDIFRNFDYNDNFISLSISGSKVI